MPTPCNGFCSVLVCFAELDCKLVIVDMRVSADLVPKDWKAFSTLTGKSYLVMLIPPPVGASVMDKQSIDDLHVCFFGLWLGYLVTISKEPFAINPFQFQGIPSRRSSESISARNFSPRSCNSRAWHERSALCIWISIQVCIWISFFMLLVVFFITQTP